MYYPYFRGKQNELLTIRDKAKLMAESSFVPIIEPVKETLNGLKRALDAVIFVQGKAVVIVNPFHGDHSNDGKTLTNMLSEHFSQEDGISAGILLKNGMSVHEVVTLCEEHANHKLTLIHAGFSEAKELAEALGEKTKSIDHCFFERDCGKLYQGHFKDATRVLIRDGFQKRNRNGDHPELELFSDLHITYKDEGMQGFGDFLIVGDDYSESGGPAYAVAIHLTFIDKDKDDAMYIHHFVSIRQDTPKDPAGKFFEALTKLINKIDELESKIFEGQAVQEFRKLHEDQHFPGLGYVKKLSMQHHIETLSNFFRRQ